MGDWLAGKLESLGVKVEKRPLGKQVLEGQELDLPAALLGELGDDPNKVRPHGSANSRSC
jgi:Cys-Gly metallodipeptidase DUG1